MSGWLVGQEPARSNCVLLSTSGEVRKDMKDWVLSQDGDRWSVKFDVRDFGGHLDTTFRGWSSTLAARVRLVISRLALLFVLPLDFHGRVRGYLVYLVFVGWFGLVACLWLVLVLFLACWMGPLGCDPAFCVVWFRFRLLRRYLALWPAEVGRVYRLLAMVREGCHGHGPVHLLSTSAAEIGFQWDPHALAWVRAWSALA